MAKQDVVQAVAAASSVSPADTEKVLDAFAGHVATQLQSGLEVEYPKLGKFHAAQATRTAPGRAAATQGEAHFRAAEALKEAAEQAPPPAPAP